MSGHTKWENLKHKSLQRRLANAEQVAKTRKGKPRKKKVHKPKHGTISEYNHWKCRCEPCRKAWRDYQREHARRYIAMVWGTEPPKHGLNGYRRYGCRCEICRTAKHNSRMRKMVIEPFGERMVDMRLGTRQRE